MENEPKVQPAEQRSRILRPLHMVSLLTLVLLVLTGAILTTRYDAINQMRDEHVVGAGFRQRIDEFAAAIVPQTSWDEAVLHADLHFDPVWADRNFGAYLKAIDGITRVFLIDTDDGGSLEKKKREGYF